METTSSLQLSRSLPEEQGISSAAIITLEIIVLENMLLLKSKINLNMGPLEFDDMFGRI